LSELLKAVETVQQYLTEQASDLQMDLEILTVNSLKADLGWVFFYSSKEFVETRNPLEGMAGNAPLVYEKKSGELHVTGTSEPIESYIEKFVEDRKS